MQNLFEMVSFFHGLSCLLCFQAQFMVSLSFVMLIGRSLASRNNVSNSEFRCSYSITRSFVLQLSRLFLCQNHLSLCRLEKIFLQSISTVHQFPKTPHSLMEWSLQIIPCLVISSNTKLIPSFK